MYVDSVSSTQLQEFPQHPGCSVTIICRKVAEGNILFLNLKRRFAEAANHSLHQALSVSLESPSYDGNHSVTGFFCLCSSLQIYFSESRSNYPGSGFGCTLEL